MGGSVGEEERGEQASSLPGSFCLFLSLPLPMKLNLCDPQHHIKLALSNTNTHTHTDTVKNAPYKHKAGAFLIISFHQNLLSSLNFLVRLHET